MRTLAPQVGNWYKDIQQNNMFEVVAYDHRAKTIEVQLIDGEIYEYDLDMWREMLLERIQEPEDWSAGYALSAEDSIDVDLPYRPEDWSGALSRIETDIVNGLIDDVDYY
jgi:hypothetical protein